MSFVQSRNKIIFYFFISILFLPFVFLNISEKHSWGDDYAQYLYQARDFLSYDKSELEILNYQDFSPKERGSGFSLLISPIYYLFQNSIKYHMLFISFFYTLMGLVLFFFFRKKLRFEKQIVLIPLLLALNVLYNYNVYLMKLYIIPVFPFMVVLYLVFLLKNNEKIFGFLIIGFLTGCLISMKNLGWCLYFSLIIYYALIFFKSYDIKRVNALLLMILIPILTNTLIKYIVYGNISFQDISWYETKFNLSELLFTIKENTLNYSEYIRMFFAQDLYKWLVYPMMYIVFFLFLMGIYRVIREKKIGLEEVFFGFYFLIILIYPYNKEGFRFLLPVFPLILLYIYYGLKYISSFVKVTKFSYLFSALSLIFLLISNYSYFKYVTMNKDKYLAGAQQKHAQEVFNFINHSISVHDVVAFTKPWCIKLFSSRSSMYFNTKIELNHLELDLEKYNVKHILVCTDSSKDAVHNSISAVYNKNIHLGTLNNENYKTLFHNDRFSLLEKIQ